MHKFQKQGGAGSEPERNGREWSRVEREICSAASEHACGLQTAAGEGHRRSLLSCSPLGWGRLGRSVGNESANFRELLAAAESAATPRAPNISKRMCRISGRGQVMTSHMRDKTQTDGTRESVCEVRNAESPGGRDGPRPPNKNAWWASIFTPRDCVAVHIRSWGRASFQVFAAVCRRSHVVAAPSAFFLTTKYCHGQDGGRVVVRAVPPIARRQKVRLALARAGRHDFLAAPVTATLASAPAANVALSVTIVLPQDLQHHVQRDRL